MKELNKEKVDNLLSMLASKDAENHTVALSVIDKIDFKKNLAAILLCYKLGRANKELWGQWAPQIFVSVEKISSKHNPTSSNHGYTFKKLLEVLVKEKVDQSQINIFLNVFSDHLLEHIQSLGYNFIEEIDMTVKLKEEYVEAE